MRDGFSRAAALAIILAAALFAVCPLSVWAASAGWGAKVDMSLRNAWQAGQRSGGTILAAVKSKSNEARVLVVFDGQPGPLPGFRMTASGGSVAAGYLNLGYLPQLASVSNVRYIRAEHRYYPTDDPGVRSVRAPRTSSRLGITGKGVLLGIIDTGIDWRHPDFRDGDGKTRIEAILDFSDSPDSIKAGELGEAGPYGGIVVYRSMIDQALEGNGTIRERDYMGHGTHVAGTAAASEGQDTVNVLGGVARGASIVMVKATDTPRDSSFSDFNILNGVRFLDSLAFFRQMPWVANLSLGGLLGPHDGTDPLEMYLDSFLKNPLRGRAIVVSAGNSRNKRAHASGDFTAAGGNAPELELNISTSAGRDDYVVTEIWLSNFHPGLEYDLYAPDSTMIATMADGDTLTAVTDYGVVFLENAFGGANSLSGSRLLSIVLTDMGATNLDTTDGNTQLADGVWRVVMHSSTGSWNSYVTSNHGVGAYFSNYSLETGTVNVPGTAAGVITVGAYIARTGWWSLDGGAGTLGPSLGNYASGTLTYFSSLGPTRDGRMKPDVTAPGRWVLGPLSADAWPEDEPLSIFVSPYSSDPLLMVATDSMHAAGQGTSFSAPHVSGVIALVLEADPTLTSIQIKDLITSSATTDSQSISAPDNYWGYGRVNAAGAVAGALGIAGDSVRFIASADPPDTLRSDSLVYTVSADFRGSLQAPTSYRLRVSWPPAGLQLRSVPDTLAAGGKIKLVSELDSLSSGVLTLSASVLDTPPDSFALLALNFAPLNAIDIDSVQVNFQTLALSGDLTGGNILALLKASQAGPLSLRLSGLCVLAGDLDGSGRRDIFDLLALLKVISNRSEATLCSDLDGNGRTDIFDLLELLKLLKQH